MWPPPKPPMWPPPPKPPPPCPPPPPPPPPWAMADVPEKTQIPNARARTVKGRLPPLRTLEIMGVLLKVVGSAFAVRLALEPRPGGNARPAGTAVPYPFYEHHCRIGPPVAFDLRRRPRTPGHGGKLSSKVG